MSDFRERLAEVLDLHNFVLQHYLKAQPLSLDKIADDALALAEQIRPMVADVPDELSRAMARGENLLFEGAQGALLDVDHGTYPYVTSSNCVAGAAAAGGRRAAVAALCAGHHQGVHDPGGLRAVPHRTVR
jgi:adenylosuccinate synthase